MMMRHSKAFYIEDKIAEEQQKYKVQCECGTKTVMATVDKTICRGCGHWVYRNKGIEFREKMKEKLRCQKKID